MGANKSNPDQYQLRFPPGLRDRVKAAADAKGRSMNSEIIMRLETALDRQDDGAISVWMPPNLLARITDMANRSETDPNLLIVEALEEMFPVPPAPLEVMEEFARSGGSENMTAEERRRWADLYDRLMGAFSATEARRPKQARKRKE